MRYSPGITSFFLRPREPEQTGKEVQQYHRRTLSVHVVDEQGVYPPSAESTSLKYLPLFQAALSMLT